MIDCSFGAPHVRVPRCSPVLGKQPTLEARGRGEISPRVPLGTEVLLIADSHNNDNNAGRVELRPRCAQLLQQRGEAG